MRSKFVGLTVAAMVGWAGAAQANLVTHGDFETGDLTGWTTSAGANIGVSATPALDGNFSAQLGDPSSAPGTLSQLLTTTPSTTYSITFLLQNQDSANSNSFIAMFGTDVLTGGSLSDPLPASNALGDPTPVFESFTDTATSSSTLLSFIESNDNSTWVLDDVVVTPVQTGVPEPSTIALIGGGLLITGLVARRRRRRSTKE